MDPASSDGRQAACGVRVANGATAPAVWLSDVVTTWVVPALRGGRPRRGAPGPDPVPGDVAVLVDRLLVDDLDGCTAILDALRDGGASADTLCLDLLAPAARRLGALWDLDRCDFAAVSHAAWRLQTLVQALDDGPHRLPHAEADRGGGRVLLGAPEGSMHRLGLVMVAGCFRRAGWRVDLDPGARPAALEHAARCRRYDVIGLCVGHEREIDAVRRLVRTLRHASCAPGVRMMVGGPGLAGRSAAAAETDADVHASDARAALALAQASRRAGLDTSARRPGDRLRTGHACRNAPARAA